MVVFIFFCTAQMVATRSDSTIDCLLLCHQYYALVHGCKYLSLCIINITCFCLLSALVDCLFPASLSIGPFTIKVYSQVHRLTTSSNKKIKKKKRKRKKERKKMVLTR